MFPYIITLCILNECDNPKHLHCCIVILHGITPAKFLSVFGENQHRLWLYAGGDLPCQTQQGGQKPCTHLINYEGSEMLTKTKRINFRVSDTMDALIRAKAQEASMSLTNYIVFCAIDRKIVNYDGLRELTTQVKRLGSNVNQLLILSRQGKIGAVNFTAVQEELKSIHELLASQLRGR